MSCAVPAALSFVGGMVVTAGVVGYFFDRIALYLLGSGALDMSEVWADE